MARKIGIAMMIAGPLLPIATWLIGNLWSSEMSKRGGGPDQNAMVVVGCGIFASLIAGFVLYFGGKAVRDR